MTIQLLSCSGSLEGGGSERQLWQLTCAIDRDLFTPALYLLRREGTYAERIPDEVEVFDFASQARAKPGWGRIHRAQVQHLISVLGQRQIQVVYDRTYHMTMITAPACRVANVARVSTIVSPPSQDFVSSQERFRWLKKWLLAKAYKASLIKNNVRTLAVSQAVARDASGFYKLPEACIQVLPSPVMAEEIRVLAEAHEPWPQNECHFVVVGRLSQEKGQASALQAFEIAFPRQTSHQQTWKLDFVGDGPDRAELEKRVSELGLESHVRFHGFLDNPYPLMACAKALLIPSQYEGLPNVALEAMALRTPVIATRCSDALTELLGEAGERGVLVGVDSPAEMAEQITPFINNVRPPEWPDRVARAHDYIAQNHNPSDWLQRMQEIFTEVAQPASASNSRGVS